MHIPTQCLFHRPVVLYWLFAAINTVLLIAVCKTSRVLIWLVPYHQIVSKHRSQTLLPQNRKLSVLQWELLLVAQWENKWLSLLVFNKSLFFTFVPSQRRKTADLPAELCLDQNQRVWSVVTFLVKLFQGKSVPGGTVKLFGRFDFSVKETSENFFFFFCFKDVRKFKILHVLLLSRDHKFICQLQVKGNYNLFWVGLIWRLAHNFFNIRGDFYHLGHRIQFISFFIWEKFTLLEVFILKHLLDFSSE